MVDHINVQGAAGLSAGAKQAMQELTSKKPVSVLQELLIKHGMVPKYHQVEGGTHGPTFCYRVTAADVEAMGSGGSMKEAKHAAAKNFLDKLIGNTDPNTINPINDQILDDKISGNPIGQLQELCMSRRWLLPTYQPVQTEGPPHKRQFTFACVVSDFMEIGTGESKQLAKHRAANKMLNKLKDI